MLCVGRLCSSSTYSFCAVCVAGHDGVGQRQAVQGSLEARKEERLCESPPPPLPSACPRTVFRRNTPPFVSWKTVQHPFVLVKRFQLFSVGCFLLLYSNRVLRLLLLRSSGLDFRVGCGCCLLDLCGRCHLCFCLLSRWL